MLLLARLSRFGSGLEADGFAADRGSRVGLTDLVGVLVAFLEGAIVTALLAVRRMGGRISIRFRREKLAS